MPMVTRFRLWTGIREIRKSGGAVHSRSQVIQWHLREKTAYPSHTVVKAVAVRLLVNLTMGSQPHLCT